MLVLKKYGAVPLELVADAEREIVALEDRHVDGRARDRRRARSGTREPVREGRETADRPGADRSSSGPTGPVFDSRLIADDSSVS